MSDGYRVLPMGEKKDVMDTDEMLFLKTIICAALNPTAGIFWDSSL